ncbi:YdcF family protein [Streptacidiphilus melanogenes]|uniref:YdcF family protein n=1 Tax=Streptacidiphilus melanogenes TaxID=411235 RepID=UPI0005A9D433|nr:YdcF family protein [Streptacidiphilus melanogenes]
MVLRTVEVLLALVFAVVAGRCRASSRLCALVALGVTCAVMALLPDLFGSPGAARTAAALLGVGVAAVVGGLALLLVADGLLLLVGQGFGRPQAATAGVGLMLAAALVVGVVCARGGRSWMAAFLALGMSTVYVTAAFLSFLGLTLLRARPWSRRRASYIIVLGAGLDDGEITPVLAARLQRALAVYRRLVAAGGDPVVVASGGQGPDEDRSEAEAMSRYMVAHGVPQERIRCEDRSRNTDENLTYSAEVIESDGSAGRCVVVTSDFHVLRTALVLNRVGLRGSVVGAPTTPSYWLTGATREFAAIIWYDRRAFLALTALLLLPGLALLPPMK